MPTSFFRCKFLAVFSTRWLERTVKMYAKKRGTHNKYCVFTYDKWTLAPSGSGRVHFNKAAAAKGNRTKQGQECGKRKSMVISSPYFDRAAPTKTFTENWDSKRHLLELPWPI